MKITVIGQGFRPSIENSVGYHLINFFSQKDFIKFTGLSAFTSQSAISGLSKYIADAKNYFQSITIITGIDKKGTSKEALESLMNLKIRSFIFYNPSISIFHPKIYLFEGIEKSELIIGSSNLTSQGLFSNIETSLLISIDNEIEEDFKVIIQLKDYFREIFDFTDPNLKKITKSLITRLVKENIVPPEIERISSYDKNEGDERKETEKLIQEIFPKRDVAKIPYGFRGKIKPKLKTRKSKPEKLLPDSGDKRFGKLIWMRKKLPSSSVQAAESGTNPTGGLRLVQDKFFYEGHRINQTTYFRNVVFSKLIWKEVKSIPFVEAAVAPFNITIFGKHIGKFNLEIRHKPSGEAGQHNYTTSISWGEAGKIIHDYELTGKQLYMYAPKGKSPTFSIVIK